MRGSFSWRDNEVLFTPRDRLKADTRYAVTLVGAHDAAGNRLGGDVSFSFTTRADAELVRFTPERHATNVKAKQVVLRFSEPMNTGCDGRRHQGGGPDHRAPHPAAAWTGSTAARSCATSSRRPCRAAA